MAAQAEGIRYLGMRNEQAVRQAGSHRVCLIHQVFNPPGVSYHRVDYTAWCHLVAPGVLYHQVYIIPLCALYHRVHYTFM